MNHLSDFGSLGGVQTYLCSLAKFKKNKIKLYSFTKPLKIYNPNNSKRLNIKSLNVISFVNLIWSVNILHNLILSKKWIPYILFHKLFRKKVVYHEHGIAWHNPDKNQIIYKKRIKDVDVIIVNSYASKKLLIEKYNIQKKINVLRSPIHLLEENKNNIKDDPYLKYNFKSLKSTKITIGFLGRLEKHKNPIYLIKVANYLKDKCGILVNLEFIGNGSEVENLKRFAELSNIETNFLGLVENRISIVKNWHFGIFPSFREPLGLVQGEMALMGTICLASEIDGIPELYPDSCNYLKIKMLKREKINSEFHNYQYVPSLNRFSRGLEPEVKDCSEKIAFLIKNPKILKKLLNDHRIFLKNNFSIQSHFESLQKIIYR